MHNFLAHHGFWLGIGTLWAFSAFVSGMPDPDDKSGTGYKWAYRSLHLFAANLDKVSQGALAKDK